MIKLTREQIEQAVLHPDGIECEAEGVDQTFVLVDADVMRQMIEAASNSDLAAIQAGLDDMEAGRMQSASEAHAHGRKQLIDRYSR